MHAIREGSGSSQTAGATNGNTPSAIPKHRYSTSRSNSFSSASVVTVKRSASLSSTGRSSVGQPPAQTSSDSSLIALKLQDQKQQRRQSLAFDPGERPNNDGVSSSHRHSQSTSSSIRSSGYTKRNRASSGALAPSLNGQGLSPSRRGAGTIDYSPRTSLQKSIPSRTSSIRRQQSQTSGLDPHSRESSRSENVSLYNVPSSNHIDSPATGSSVLSPISQTDGPDYAWKNTASAQKVTGSHQPNMIRSRTAPPSSTEAQAVAGASQDGHSITYDHRNDGRSRVAASGEYAETRMGEARKQSGGREGGRHKHRSRDQSEKDKKSMLAKALEKANTAVLLDNAQNFEGALEAYADACRLLQQVTERSSGPDDKRKLNAIKHTYITRIEELRQLPSTPPDSSPEKSLAAARLSDNRSAASRSVTSPIAQSYTRDMPLDARAASSSVPLTRYQDQQAEFYVGDRYYGTQQTNTGRLPTDRSPEKGGTTAWQRQDISLFAEPVEPELWNDRPSRYIAQEPPSLRTDTIDLGRSERDLYTPAPLSPSRSPTRRESPQAKAELREALYEDPEHSLPRFERQDSQESKDGNGPASWLDTIDEDSSRRSSTHSMSSQRGLQRRHLASESGMIFNSDFDAAFDAAVEAAYDQGLEPDTETADARSATGPKRTTQSSIPVRSSEIAEISPTAKKQLFERFNVPAEDEEDEMVDGIAQDYAHTFNFDTGTKSALPRQSGSSGCSRSTWQSSHISHRTTGNTSLSAVAEDDLPHTGSKNAFAASPPLLNPGFDLHPPPTRPPPLVVPPPQSSLPRLPTDNQAQPSTVRNRRLSGQNMRQLKIETPGPADPRKRASTMHSTGSGKPSTTPDYDPSSLPQIRTASDTQAMSSVRSPPSLNVTLTSAGSDTSRADTATTIEQRESLEDELGELRAHKSRALQNSRSADGLREHMVLLSTPTVDNGPALYTPLSSTFASFSSKRMNETPLTSQRATFPSFSGASAAGTYQGMMLFDTSLSEAQSSTYPKSPGVPTGVEPCPESYLLRPFWLMRNILASLTHPKGAFLTSRLFVSREVWHMKSMKLKYVEEKIANCDLLTAALGRLAVVDTYDADAVMEELESFEDVLERVQAALARKLSGEVGTSGLSSMFKDGPNSAGLAANGASAHDAGVEKSKGVLSSWRKLRSKSSGSAGSALQPSKASLTSLEGVGKSAAVVPMTSVISLDRRGVKKEAKNFTFEGPNQNYMGSLARLFEAVQVLDQIARQVEDPGLRGTSQTHVGLELSIRHAAEFFAFYVLRFVLADLNILIDKFVKRGVEWVLA